MIFFGICAMITWVCPLTMEQSIDIAWPHIIWFEQKYEPAQTYQLRTGTKPLRDESRSNAIDPSVIALRTQLESYYRSPAHRDISQYGSCAKHNYTIAAEHFGKIVLEPWDTFDIGQHITDLDYCTWWSKQKFMFYQWVCGLSTQLFRASLITPGLQIVRRAPHTKRYTKYYGDIVYGDDSAIYEDQKKLIIKNVSDSPIYLRTLIGENYLVSVSQSAPTVSITKKRDTDMSARLIRTIAESQTTTQRNSVYNGKITTSN